MATSPEKSLSHSRLKGLSTAEVVPSKKVAELCGRTSDLGTLGSSCFAFFFGEERMKQNIFLCCKFCQWHIGLWQMWWKNGTSWTEALLSQGQHWHFCHLTELYLFITTPKPIFSGKQHSGASPKVGENTLLSLFQPRAFGNRFEPHQVFPVRNRALNQCLMSLDKAGEASLQQIPDFSDSAGIKKSLSQLFLCIILPQLLFAASFVGFPDFLCSNS